MAILFLCKGIGVETNRGEISFYRIYLGFLGKRGN